MTGVQHVAQPGGVFHQVAHGDALTPRYIFDLHLPIGILSRVDLEVSKRGDVFRYRIVELPLAFLVKHHQCHPNDGLGHRIDPEDRVEFDGIVFAHIELADRVGVYYLAVTRQHRHNAGQLAIVNHRLHAGIEPLKTLGRNPDVLGLRGCKVACQLGLSRRRRTLQREYADDHCQEQRHDEE